MVLATQLRAMISTAATRHHLGSKGHTRRLAAIFYNWSWVEASKYPSTWVLFFQYNRDWCHHGLPIPYWFPFYAFTQVIHMVQPKLLMPHIGWPNWSPTSPTKANIWFANIDSTTYSQVSQCCDYHPWYHHPPNLLRFFGFHDIVYPPIREISGLDLQIKPSIIDHCWKV